MLHRDGYSNGDGDGMRNDHFPKFKGGFYGWDVPNTQIGTFWDGKRQLFEVFMQHLPPEMGVVIVFGFSLIASFIEFCHIFSNWVFSKNFIWHCLFFSNLPPSNSCWICYWSLPHCFDGVVLFSLDLRCLVSFALFFFCLSIKISIILPKFF